jgi:hypothetical protein
MDSPDDDERDSPDALELLQQNSEWVELVHTAGTPSGEKNININVAFKLLQSYRKQDWPAHI